MKNIIKREFHSLNLAIISIFLVSLFFSISIQSVHAGWITSNIFGGGNFLTDEILGVDPHRNNNGGSTQTPAVSNITGSCTPNKTSVKIGESVEWTVNASGPYTVYKYTWTGTDGLSGSNSSVIKSYDSTGTKSASVTVKNSKPCTACSKTETFSCGTVVVENIQDLNVSCSANPNTVNVGEQLTWTANASGGTGSYTYTWIGTNSLSGNSDTVVKTYSTEGTKTARVTVRSGNQTAYKDCTGYVRDTPIDDLQVSCSSNYDEIETGDSVRYTADATGGSGSYRYSWSGTNSLSGTSRTVTKNYSTDGEKTARITVTSGGQTASATCYVDVNDNQADDLEVSCSSNYDEIETGDSVRYTADATGGSGSYRYSWSGTNSLSGSSRTATKYYSTEGRKTARITVTSGGQTASDTCYIDVSDNQVLSYVQNTNPVMPLTASVYLSDIPYTGAGDNIKIILFILTLGLWGVFLSYYLLKKNNNVNLKEVVVSKSNNISSNNSFKVQDNFAKNIESDNKALTDIEDYARMNKVLLSSSATEKIFKLSRLGKVKANEVIKSLSTGEWTAVSDEDVK
jgi:hypothetical protein